MSTSPPLGMLEQGGILFLVFVGCMVVLAVVGMMLFRKGGVDCSRWLCCLLLIVAYKKCCGCQWGCCENARKKLEEAASEED
jgi:hypothetical protein